MSAIIQAVAERSTTVPTDEEGFIEIKGDYTAALEHEGMEPKVSLDGCRSYLMDDPSTPPAWRIFHDHDRTRMHMPADWSPERVRETFLWYLKGEAAGESYGVKMGKRQIQDAISELRELGIGTVLLPSVD